LRGTGARVKMKLRAANLSTPATPKEVLHMHSPRNLYVESM